MKALYDAALFVEKLKTKNQTGQQRKQAVDAVSMSFHLRNTGPEGDSVRVLKYTDAEISIKKEALDPIKMAGRAFYHGLRHDQPALFMDAEIT